MLCYFFDQPRKYKRSKTLWKKKYKMETEYLSIEAHELS